MVGHLFLSVVPALRRWSQGDLWGSLTGPWNLLVEVQVRKRPCLKKQWGTLSQEKGDWYPRSELKPSSGLDICSPPPPTTSLNRFLFTTFLASMITQKTWHASDCTVGVDEWSSVQVCTQIDLIINCEINSSFHLMIRYWNMKSGLLLYSHSVYSGSW